MQWPCKVIRQRGLIVILAGVMVIAGVAGGIRMPQGLFPGLNVPVVNLMVHIPGMSSEDLDLLAARPIQAATRNLPGVRRVQSISKQDLSITTIQFAGDISVDEARRVVAANLSRIRGTLPKNARLRLENIGTTLQQIAGYVIYGADPFVLRREAGYGLANALRGINGVARVDCFGGEQQAFVIRVNQAVMAANRVKLSDVVNAVSRENTMIAAGYGKMGAQDAVLRGDGLFHGPKDMEFLPITGQSGESIPLEAVARVGFGKRPRRYEVSGNNRPAVAIIVHKQPGASVVAVSRAVKRVISSQAGHFPRGTQIRMFYDQAEVINAAGREIDWDLLFGFILVVLVLFFFLHRPRLTFVTAIQVPLVLTGTLAIMAAMGMGLNVITMTALVLAVGMVVDDAIVVSENILRVADNGPITAKIASEGARGIAGPDISGTLTTVAVFLPLIFVPGIAGQFTRPFGITVSIALLVSMVLSLCFVPAFLTGKYVMRDRLHIGDMVMNSIRGGVGRVLGWCMAHRLWVIIAAMVFVIAGGGSLVLQKVAILPNVDDNTVLIEYQLPAGVSMRESNRIGRAVEEIAMKVPGMDTVYRRTGSPDTGNQIEGVSRGEITIHLRKGHAMSASQVFAWLRKRLSSMKGVTFLYHQVMQEKIDDSLWGLPATFAVTISGPDQAILGRIAARAAAVMARDPAIVSVFNPGAQQGVSIRVRPASEACIKYGVDPREVLLTLQAAGFGIPATVIRREREAIPVIVKLGMSVADTSDAIKRLPVQGKNGPIPMSRVASVKAVTVPAIVSRLNSRRVITLGADVNGPVSDLIGRLRPALAALSMPPGYSIEFTGSYQAQSRIKLYMSFVFLAALFLIFGIMYIQFNSFTQPLIIMAVVPVAMAGSLMAAFIAQTGLDLTGAMGMLTVAGVVVNNGIVLLTFANRHTRPGTQEALSTAVSVRLRPMLLTMITTIFALVPTVIGFTSMPVLRPFAIAVTGGLISGLPAQLFLVPVLAIKRTGTRAG